MDDFARTLNEGGQTDVYIALDFSKAFDRVPHGRLLYKLDHYGICGPVLQWIQYFLENRSQQVVIEGQESCSIKVSSGVPQGTVLAPLLFLCYINDLPSQVKSKVKLHVYADDVLPILQLIVTQTALLFRMTWICFKDGKKTGRCNLT